MPFGRFASVLLVAGLSGFPAPAEAQVTSSSVTLWWTTPGDDSLTGTASEFDLRYSRSPISAANFASATRWGAVPPPAAPGTRQSATVTGLLPGTPYHFAIKTADNVPNWSGISNVISRTTLAAPDTIRPARLAVSVIGVTDSTATLSWAAVGDDSLAGAASSYDIRYATSPITEATWGAATRAPDPPVPAAAGTLQSYVVRGLGRRVTYYFAARAVDDVGHASGLSNVPSVTTPDTMPPAAIRDLATSFLWFGWRSASALLPDPVEAPLP